MGTLEGKVALVTGSGRGLGLACAKLFAREGARVVIVDIDPETGNDAVAQLRSMGAEAVFAHTDLGKSEDIQRMVQTAVDTFGRLDCAVNNAVLNIGRTPLADITEADWRKALDVNFNAVFLGMRYQIQAMLPQGSGAIVNIGSGNEHSAKPGLAWYLPVKQAIYGLTKVAALDYAKQGLRINAVGPGSMWTPALRETASQNPKHVEVLQSYTPLGRLSEPEEVAEAVVWLCSPAASYVLGHTLVADGGAVMGAT